MNRFCMFLGVFAIATSYSVEPSLQKQDNAALIYQALQESNETDFFNRGLRLELLNNCPETIDVLAEWEYQDWHQYDNSYTREGIIHDFHHCLHDARLPLTLVLFKDSVPIGGITLKDRSVPELSDLEDGNPWGGSFHVIPAERNRGIGEAMAKALVAVAKRLGYAKIHFYTSNPQVVGWYTERGAKIVDTRPYRGHMITTLEYSFGS